MTTPHQKCKNDATMWHLSNFRIFWKIFSFFFPIKNVVLDGEQEKITHYLCKDGIENPSVRDHHLSSLSKHHDANC